jgi:hypothetical protein
MHRINVNWTAHNSQSRHDTLLGSSAAFDRTPNEKSNFSLKISLMCDVAVAFPALQMSRLHCIFRSAVLYWEQKHTSHTFSTWWVATEQADKSSRHADRRVYRTKTKKENDSTTTMNNCGTRHPGNEPRTQERWLSASLRGFSFSLVLNGAQARAAQKTSNIIF